MDNQLLTGELVRLTMEDAGTIACQVARWSRDSEYWRLSCADPGRTFSVKASTNWWEKQLEKEPPPFYPFMIRTLLDNRLVGDIDLGGVAWSHGEAWVGIGIGERDCWGKGYGTDAMRIILRYAFTELNLHRVSLNVFAYNPRAIRSYEKVGFAHEGRQRQVLYRDGRFYDLVFMGILRSEWEQKYGRKN